MSKQVLVVYDEDDLRDSLCENVREAGYTVEGVGSGQLAIQMVRQTGGKLDFILMDQVLMGGIDGLETTRIIHREYPEIRIIVLTQYGDGESSRRALDVGAYRYVFRPGLDEEIINLMQYSEYLAKLEQGLKGAEQVPWMQVVFNETEVVTSIIDRTYRVLYANAGQRKLAGEGLRLGGICWVEFHQFYNQKEPCAWCPVKPLFETGKPVRTTAVLLKRDQALYYETGASPIFGEDRQTILAARKWGVEVTARELSDRRTLEAATFDERLNAGLERIRALGYSRARLYELSEDGQLLIGRKEHGKTKVPFAEVRLAVKDDRYSQITLAGCAPRIYKAGQHGPTQLDNELDRVGLEEWLDIPLCTSDSEPVGKITIDNKPVGPIRPDRESRPKPITEEHFELLTKIATFAANTIREERERKRMKREAELLRDLRAIDADITSELGVMAVVQRTLAAALDLTGATSGNMRLRDGDRLIKVAGIGPHSGIIEEELSISRHRDVPSVQAVLAGQPYAANDAQSDGYIVEWISGTNDPGVRRIIESIGSFVSSPLQFGEQTIGVLSLQSEKKDFFTSDICALVEDLKPRAARALRNAQLYERRIRESEALRKTDAAVLSATELEEELQTILDELLTLIPYECALIRLFDEDSQELELKATKGKHPGEIMKRKKMGMGISGLAAQDKRTILENDVTQHLAHQRALRECKNDREKEFLSWIKAEVAIPLKIGERLIGVLSLQKSEIGGFLGADVLLMEDFAGRAAIAIENTRLRQQLERRVQQLRSMSLVAIRIQSTTDPDAMLRLALTGVTAKQGLRFSRAMLFLTNEDKTMLQGRMAVGAVTYEEADRIWKEVEEKQFTLEEQLGRAEKLGEELNRPLNALVCQISIPIQKESGTPALCLFERRAIIVSDALTDSLTNHHLADALDMTAFAAVPLIAKGEFVGTLVVDNRFLPKETINEEDVRVLETFASEAAMIIENVRLRDQLLEQRKLEAWKQFAARAAHRVGTQLSIIREALTETPSGTMVDSQSLNEGIERMKRVLEELKQFARPREPHFEILDLNKIIQQVRDRSPEELNFALALNLAPDLPLLEGDAQAIFDTFVELLRNATDAIPKDGSGKITITTTFLPSGSPDPTREGQLVYTSHICVEFVDNGPGVLPKDKDAIFHPFHSLKAKSSGLGLAIAKEEIEEIHHGVIREVGTYGQGARFVILLPLTQPKGG